MVAAFHSEHRVPGNLYYRTVPTSPEARYDVVMETFTAVDEQMVYSSVISHVWYGTLEDKPGILIKFNSKARFFYPAERSVYEALLGSSSAGSFYNSQIKGQGGVPFNGTVAFASPDLGAKHFAVELKPVHVSNKDVRVQADTIQEAVEKAEKDNPGFAVVAVREFDA
jgi:hypothetical protein